MRAGNAAIVAYIKFLRPACRRRATSRARRRQHAGARPRRRSQARRARSMRDNAPAATTPTAAGIRRSRRRPISATWCRRSGAGQFNNGAGMARLVTAANFVHSNMPHGADYLESRASTVEQRGTLRPTSVAAAAAEIRARKGFSGSALKPVDTPYRPYRDGFSETQHKYGPFAPIRAAPARLKPSVSQAADL